LRTHFVPVKSYRLHGTPDVCHECVESVMVVHIEAIATEPCEEPEQSTKNRDREDDRSLSLCGHAPSPRLA
jgi:hypothetical protein